MKHNCDLCNHDNPLPIEAARPYVGDNDVPCVCGNCGFCYITERRAPEEVAAAWTDIWGDGYTSAWPAVKARLTYVAEWIDQNIGLEGKSVLDIGAGEGEFLEIAQRMGATVAGIEPSAENISRMMNNAFRVHRGTCESVTLVDKFDIVTVNWTLENTGNCIGFLKKAREFLKPDGHLVVATGSRILVPYKKKMSDYFSDNPADTHCFRFSAQSLSRAISEAGFERTVCNRYEDSDWLVVSGDMHGADPVLCGQCDDPQEVLQFFDDWKRMWP